MDGGRAWWIVPGTYSFILHSFAGWSVDFPYPCAFSPGIAWLCARTFNRIVTAHHPDTAEAFGYCISGGSRSILFSLLFTTYAMGNNVTVNGELFCTTDSINAGGDESLVISNELPEDDPHAV